MRVLGLDLETTGFLTDKDVITELGVVLWEVEQKRPLTTVGMFCKSPNQAPFFANKEVTDMMARVCGITPALVEEFGTDTKENLQWLDGYVARHKVEYVVAHNGENYDKPLLYAELDRHGLPAPYLRSLPWIDTRTDLPFASEPDSRKLKHLAVDHGFLNPFAHRAVFDVLSMLRILSNYDFEKVVEYSKIPFITVRALVSFDDRQLAKDNRYSWEKLGSKEYKKSWVKRIKADQLEAEQKICKFQVAQIE